KPVPEGHHEKRGFFGWFDRSFARLTARYEGWVAAILRRTVRALLAFALVLGAVAWLFVRLPGAFLPEEDQGYWISSVQLPSDATAERTNEVLRAYEAFEAER